eukprot:364341-Chlamydomonas_euryale.AAC.8
MGPPSGRLVHTVRYPCPLQTGRCPMGPPPGRLVHTLPATHVLVAVAVPAVGRVGVVQHKLDERVGRVVHNLQGGCVGSKRRCDCGGMCGEGHRWHVWRGTQVACVERDTAGMCGEGHSCTMLVLSIRDTRHVQTCCFSCN